MYWVHRVSIVLISLRVLQGNALAFETIKPEYFNPLSDSINENVILIYDTVQLPPDTIRLTDTLTIIKNKLKKTDEIIPKNSNITNERSAQNQQSKYFISLSISPFITLQHFYSGELKDSIKYLTNQPLNFHYEINSGLKINRWVFYSGIHFINFSEVAEKEQFIDENDSIEIDGEIYYNSKSIHIKRQIKNYFYYAGILLGVGYELRMRNFIFSPQTGINISRKLYNRSYKFEKGVDIKYNTKEDQINYWVSISISPGFEFSITKKVLLQIMPAYIYNIYRNNIYPYTYRHNFRLGVGIKFEL